MDYYIQMSRVVLGCAQRAAALRLRTGGVLLSQWERALEHTSEHASAYPWDRGSPACGPAALPRIGRPRIPCPPSCRPRGPRPSLPGAHSVPRPRAAPYSMRPTAGVDRILRTRPTGILWRISRRTPTLVFIESKSEEFTWLTTSATRRHARVRHSDHSNSLGYVFPVAWAPPWPTSAANVF